MQSPDGKDFRFISLRDAESLLETRYKVFKNNQPYLWKNIEKAENRSGTSLTISGKIEKYNGIEIAIFDGESVKEAYEKQKWKVKERRIISRKEAEKMAINSQGYITNKTKGNMMHQSWTNIHSEAGKIKFRYYHKADKYDLKRHSFFEWTDWYEIVGGLSG